MLLMLFAICCGASGIGAICGIGGGVIIKPVLDAFKLADVATISFLSGTTVLTMTTYSVIRSKLSGSSKFDLSIGTPLAIGAVFGGIFGQKVFQIALEIAPSIRLVGATQQIFMIILTTGTLIYVLEKNKISTKKFSSKIICLAIGFFLGTASAFLGIGGGPINLVVLYYFFSMETKTAAENSLYIIFFSQMASFLQTIFTDSLPNFTTTMLIFMVAGGLFGGMIGRSLNKKLNNNLVEKLFVRLMVVIIGISFYNLNTFM